MKKTIYLHIGKHKTGSTSIQNYLNENKEFFCESGFFVVESLLDEIVKKRRGTFPSRGVFPSNCANVAHIAIRNDLLTPRRIRGLEKKRSYIRKIVDAYYINKKIRGFECELIILSAEAFSFIRTFGERLILRVMFRGFFVIPIVFFRDSKSWLSSWGKQLANIKNSSKGYELSTEGIFDFSENSWLVDDDAIVKVFGRETIVVSYENSLDKDGSVIPSFLESLGLNPKNCPSWSEYWFNKSKDKKLK